MTEDDDAPFWWLFGYGFLLHDRGWLVINSRSVIVAEGYWPRRRWWQGMR